MVNIAEFIKKIREARYGSEVRDSIADSLEAISEEVNSASHFLETAQEAARVAQEASRTAAEYSETAKSVADVSIATNGNAGIVKPDGDTIKISDDGTIESAHVKSATGVSITIGCVSAAPIILDAIAENLTVAYRSNDGESVEKVISAGMNYDLFLESESGKFEISNDGDYIMRITYAVDEIGAKLLRSFYDSKRALMMCKKSAGFEKQSIEVPNGNLIISKTGGSVNVNMKDILYGDLKNISLPDEWKPSQIFYGTVYVKCAADSNRYVGLMDVKKDGSIGLSYSIAGVNASPAGNDLIYGCLNYPIDNQEYFCMPKIEELSI